LLPESIPRDGLRDLRRELEFPQRAGSESASAAQATVVDQRAVCDKQTFAAVRAHRQSYC